MAFSFIVYLLLMPNSSKEQKIVGKVEYVFTIIFMVLLFTLLGSSFVPREHACGLSKIDLVCLNMKGVSNALKMFKLDNRVYPTTNEGFHSLLSNPNPLEYPNYASDGYLDRLPKDAWGAKMLYLKTKDGFELVSYGADRKEGGKDDGADILYSECQ